MVSPLINDGRKQGHDLRVYLSYPYKLYSGIQGGKRA